jgi:hypothetical protein
MPFELAWFVLSCVVTTTTTKNNNINIADRDDPNFMMVSQIGTIEYGFLIKFLCCI